MKVNKEAPRGEKRAETALRRAVAALEDVSVRRAQDGRLEVGAPGISPMKLRTFWAGEGWPGDIHDLLADIPAPWPRDTIVVAAHLSPGAVDQLNRVGANFVDEAGRARLVVPPGLIIERDATTPRKVGRRGWAPSAEAVGEWLLARSARSPQALTVKALEVAAATGWSHAQVSNVLRFFDEQGWTRREGAQRGPTARRVLVDALGLLDAWSGHVASAPRPAVLTHALFNDPAEWVTDVLARKVRDVPWALSGIVAAEEQHRSMIGAPGIVHCYLPGDDFDASVESVCDQAGLRPVDSGERVVLWPGPPWMWAEVRETLGSHLQVASVARVHADLIRIGGRGPDAAAALREHTFQSR